MLFHFKEIITLRNCFVWNCFATEKKNIWKSQYLKTVQVSGRFRGEPNPPTPPRPKIFSISCSFSEILTKLYVGVPHPPKVGAPSHRESWIRPCKWILFVCTTCQFCYTVCGIRCSKILIISVIVIGTIPNIGCWLHLASPIRMHHLFSFLIQLLFSQADGEEIDMMSWKEKEEWMYEEDEIMLFKKCHLIAKVYLCILCVCAYYKRTYELHTLNEFCFFFVTV